MIDLYPCACGKLAAAFCTAETCPDHCPACGPTPEKKPHEYTRPVPVLVTLFDEVHTTTNADLTKPFIAGVPPKNGKTLATENLISGVCCADAGDCGHSCGVA